MAAHTFTFVEIGSPVARQENEGKVSKEVITEDKPRKEKRREEKSKVLQQEKKLPTFGGCRGRVCRVELFAARSSQAFVDEPCWHDNRGGILDFRCQLYIKRLFNIDWQDYC